MTLRSSPDRPEARARASGLLAAALALATLAAADRLSYIDGPPPAHTGGFGEPTCHTCHFDNPLNDPEGALVIKGLPERYQPGETYSITVEVRRPGTRRVGFQAAIRYAEGAEAGRSAGGLRVVDETVERVEADSVTYVQHTPEGSFPQEDRGRWEVEWTAPTEDHGSVVLHTSANAGNDDNSSFGDFIYVAEVLSRRGAPP